MSVYTLYKKDSLELQGIVNTSLPINLYTDDSISYISGSYTKNHYYLAEESGIVKPFFKNDFNAEVVSLSVYNDLKYYTIFNNVPNGTEIIVDDDTLGTLTATESFEYATDKVGFINVSFYNESYNLSSQIFTLTSYEI